VRSFVGRLRWQARHATVPLLLPGLLCAWPPRLWGSAEPGAARTAGAVRRAAGRTGGGLRLVGVWGMGAAASRCCSRASAGPRSAPPVAHGPARLRLGPPTGDPGDLPRQDLMA
jgi:hypothetical protein